MTEPYVAYTDCMIDLETTDTDPSRGHILQIAAVKFNSRTREISHETFDRCLLPMPNRRWAEDTRAWWAKRPEVVQALMRRMEDPLTVLQDLQAWAGHSQMMMWGKPTHFDHSFLASYYRDFGLQIPFHYRSGAQDMNSFIRGRYWPEEPPQWERLLDFTGEQHNALDDCWHQLKVVFKVLDGAKP